ncbi:MAG: histidine phosphatase family protein [Acidobacteria bacterium]|nr:histidine phosphatase family protein [Acidobacteriota bacterium]
MTIFYLVRHASCNGLGEKLWGRREGVCLTENGKAEARQLAERFREVKLNAIYSSPLERARETAEAIARLGGFEVALSDAFNEIDFGNWTGRSFAQLAGDERWRSFNTRRSITSIPGGESFLDVQARVVAELKRLSLEHPDERVAIVSHADVIKAAIGYAKETPIDLLQSIEIAPCSVTVLIADKYEIRVK